MLRIVINFETECVIIGQKSENDRPNFSKGCKEVVIRDRYLDQMLGLAHVCQ